MANGIQKQKNPAIRQEFFYKSSRNRNAFQMGVSMDPLPLVEEDSVVYVIQEAIPAAKGPRMGRILEWNRSLSSWSHEVANGIQELKNPT